MLVVSLSIYHPNSVMKFTKTLRYAIQSRITALAGFAVAMVFTAPTAQAGNAGGSAGVVTYNIPLQIEQGNMPYTNAYTLLITSPAGLTAGNYQINLDLTLLTAPAGVTASQGLGFVSISSNTSQTGGLVNGLPGTLIGNVQQRAAQISFTGPNQQVAVTVTTNIPLGAWAGSFGYKITTRGWAASLGVVDPGANINNQVSFPSGLPSLPGVQILSPVDETTYTMVAGGPALVIPYSFVGSTADGSPLIAMNASVNGQDMGLTASGLFQGFTNATASGNITITAPGVYTFTVNDANANGVGSSSVQINVQVQAGPPSVVINSPSPSATFVLSGNEVDVPFTFTGYSQFGGITNLVATLDGVPLNVSSGDIGKLAALGSGVLPLTSVGNHTLAVTAYDNFGVASTAETVIVVAGSPPNRGS